MFEERAIQAQESLIERYHSLKSTYNQLKGSIQDITINKGGSLYDLIPVMNCAITGLQLIQSVDKIKIAEKNTGRELFPQKLEKEMIELMNNIRFYRKLGSVASEGI
jgi:hypothetical protein